MKIYTKTGDKGSTGLVGGSRVSKDDARIEAVGQLDELNATIGLVRLYSAGFSLDPLLNRVQHWLFDLGAEVATPHDSKYFAPSVSQSQIEQFESSIDELTEALSPLKNFILPGGCELAAHIHQARVVCRRAERALVRLGNDAEMRAEILIFLNRLSDWLFVAARQANAEGGVSDVIWQQKDKDS